MHAAAGEVQVLGDLAARLAGAHHEDRAPGELAGVAVVSGMHLDHVVGQPLGHPRSPWDLVGTGRHHDLVGGQGPHVGADLEAPPAGAQPGDTHPLHQRRGERGDEPVEVVEDPVADHEPVGVVPVVGEAGQRALPVRGDQAEGVPAPVAPLVAGGLRLEHDVVEAAPGEPPAHRQPRLAAADHDDGAVAAVERRAGRRDPAYGVRHGCCSRSLACRRVKRAAVFGRLRPDSRVVSGPEFCVGQLSGPSHRTRPGGAGREAPDRGVTRTRRRRASGQGSPTDDAATGR